MEKEFIPYEQALALKELGFDEKCLSYPMSNTDVSGRTWTSVIVAPLYQQAFRWFREKHQKNIIIFSDGCQWTFDLRWVDEDSLDKYPTIQFPRREVGREWFDTYEEAELECLKKLIEIVKNK